MRDPENKSRGVIAVRAEGLQGSFERWIGLGHAERWGKSLSARENLGSKGKRQKCWTCSATSLQAGGAGAQNAALGMKSGRNLACRKDGSRLCSCAPRPTMLAEGFHVH